MTARKKKARGKADRVIMYLRLYVAGNSPSSLEAIANAEAICAKHYAGAHVLEVLELLDRPGQALTDGVIVTPTLVRIFPSPVRRVVGNLSQTRTVLLALAAK
jgi:circadian clock protein KaiB